MVYFFLYVCSIYQYQYVRIQCVYTAKSVLNASVANSEVTIYNDAPFPYIYVSYGVAVFKCLDSNRDQVIKNMVKLATWI